MSPAPEPTSWARDLVRGAYDLHVHVSPDLMRRRVDDLCLARSFGELGMAGFVLKSHYVPTAERAQVVSRSVPGVRVLGALALNASVGGINPLAVEVAAREGAAVVWMPTVDAANHRLKRDQLPEGATPPVWLALQQELEGRGMGVPPVAVVDGRGGLLPETERVLALVAEHDLVLATGHLGGEEVSAVVEGATRLGVRRVIVTHPEFPQQGIGPEQQAALLRPGVFLERCYTTPFTGKCDWAEMARNIRLTGPSHSVVTTDLGQPGNPPVEDGLALMADALRGAGFTDAEIRTMIVDNSRLLAAAPEAPA